MRRAFTLLELAVVLTILLTAAVMVFSFSLAGLGRSETVESVPRIEAAAMMARAEAIRRQVVVVLVAHEEEDGRGCIDLLARERRAGPAPGVASGESAPRFRFGPVVAEASLPAGVRLDAEVPEEDDENGEQAAPDHRAERMLAIATPDGFVSAVGPLRVTGRDGRGFRLAINRWTGRVTAEPVAAVSRADDSPEPAKRKSRSPAEEPTEVPP